MENPDKKHSIDQPSTGMPAKDSQENHLNESEAQTGSADQSNDNNEKPLPKIHPNLHSHGYKMFSNRSSGDDIPKTSTGV